VMVFSGNGLVNTFHIPEGVRGNQWTVFEIQGGEVVTIDRVETSP
jgi:hypothetical protein